MRVLVVAAHPDDAEIAMAMRIRWHVLRGDRVEVHVLSPGAQDPNLARTRTGEARAAGAVLGVAGYTFGDAADTRFVEQRGLINADLFARFGAGRPDVVYTHFPDDQHLDHRVAAEEVTTVALREANDLVYFRSPYSVRIEPTVFLVATAELLAAKREALACFASQAHLDLPVFTALAEVAHRQHVHHRVVERFPAGHRYAEAFVLRRRIDFTDC